MATVPLSGTNIRLLTGIPFHNDYKNTRWFDTKSEQTNYFLNKPTSYTKSDHTFQRIEDRHFIKVDKSIDELWGTNYLMFQNSLYNSKWFYAFVTKLEYVNPTNTKVYFQIDVFQTWLFEMNFKPSFVMREHCDLWNEDGTPIENTIDEGLNYGTNYDTVSVEHWRPFSDIFFLVIVSQSGIHYENKTPDATINAIPQPLTYYVHPFKLDGTALEVGVGNQVYGLAPLAQMLNRIATNDETVNNIASMYVTDFVGKDMTITNGVPSFSDEEFEWVRVGGGDVSQADWLTIKVNYIREYDPITHNFGNKYSGFKPVKESKLLMYPYTVTLLDDFKGNRIELRNEYIEGQDLKITARGSIGTSNKVSYSVVDYLTEGIQNDKERLIVSLEHSLINNDPNDIPIISDFLSAYLQGNKNQIDNQKQAIMLNGSFGALTSGAVGASQSSWISKGNMMVNPIGMATAVGQAGMGVGNAIVQLQGIEAKIKDITNTPPQLVKMGSNTAFDFGNGYTGVYIIKKQIKDEYINQLSDFFNLYGYKVNRVKLPNFHTRKYWNFIQTVNCTIVGNFNNDDLTELKNVFDNGITLWHTDDVGNYALENEVI